MNRLPHLLLETANFHGGDAARLEQAIDEFAAVPYPDKGIKFHAFDPDRVALPDFSWYPVVKNFFIPAERWRELIERAATRGFKVWLDLFCTYGVEVLGRSLSGVHGLKLQPSVLDNLEILEALQTLDLRGQELIINVSGLELADIARVRERMLGFGLSRVILQAGFQDYPTSPEDTSLAKLEQLAAGFPDAPLAYADHIDATDPFARRFPVYAWLKGCACLEKHVCLSRADTRHDFQSALEPAEIADLGAELQHAARCFPEEFIPERERCYFAKTLQKPVLKSGLRSGELVAAGDLLFRRTDKPGLTWPGLQETQNEMRILARDVPALEPLLTTDFRRPRIAAIVAARMKSSRLKQKAVLPIQGMASIERCLDNCLRFPFVDEVVLATSTVEEDAVLGGYTLGGRARFWQGDPEDVISRYLGACERWGIDVIVRVTGDCPCVSPEIVDFILRAHFASGADFTEPRRFAVGSNSQIYNVAALRRVIELVGKADYSEHMTLYMVNNPAIFKINRVDLPEELVRPYRLTLDYPEDLDMFNALYAGLADAGLDAGLSNVFRVLDGHPEIVALNAHKTLVYQTDPELIRLLNEKTTIHLPRP
jgi:N,N'-diacetyllegionaminate synthase